MGICGDLNEKCPSWAQVFECLAPVVGTVWGGLGSVALAGGGMSLGMGFGPYTVCL